MRSFSSKKLKQEKQNNLHFHSIRALKSVYDERYVCGHLLDLQQDNSHHIEKQGITLITDRTHQLVTCICKIKTNLGGKICFGHTLLKSATVDMGTHPWSSIKEIR